MWRTKDRWTPIILINKIKSKELFLDLQNQVKELTLLVEQLGSIVNDNKNLIEQNIDSSKKIIDVLLKILKIGSK